MHQQNGLMINSQSVQIKTESLTNQKITSKMFSIDLEPLTVTNMKRNCETLEQKCKTDFRVVPGFHKMKQFKV